MNHPVPFTYPHPYTLVATVGEHASYLFFVSLKV
jgi:hypothetical protein